MKTVLINIKMSPDMLAELNKSTAAQYSSRSEFIRQAIVEKMLRVDAPVPINSLPTGEQELTDLFNDVRQAFGRMTSNKRMRQERKANRRRPT